MNLSKNQKIGIGVLTFMPILFFIGYFLSFFLIFFGTFSEISQGGMTDSQAPPAGFFAGMGLAMLCILLAVLSGLAAMILHIVHITQNEKLKAQRNGQLLWILVIVFANGIGGIIYYFIEILPEPKDTSGQNPIDKQL